LNTKAFLHSIRSSLNISNNHNENIYEQSDEKIKKLNNSYHTDEQLFPKTYSGIRKGELIKVV
jgi:hypothetical protein